jgi:AmmeMemoRadiSam system protein A
MLNKKEQNYLLSLARRNLEQYLAGKSEVQVDESQLPSEKLAEARGTFVTLTSRPDEAGARGQLRGCIGHILPVQKLYLDVIENSITAATGDPRFDPVILQELPEIQIEISVLDVPVAMAYSSQEDLAARLAKTKPGVILSMGPYNQATFLPQVWEQLPDAEIFLSHLCQKAGLPADAWKTKKLKIETYGAEVFEEE